MHRRWGQMLMGLVFLTAGCRTLDLSKEERTEPIAELYPPVNGDDDPPPPELPPKDAARACLACAEEMEKTGNELQAIIFYERARAKDPKCRVSRQLAVLYDRQGDFQKAQEEYRKALKKSPRDADLLNDMGYGYYSRGRWAEAETYLRRALAAKSDHRHATMNLALCVGEQGRYREALELFQKVVTPAQAQCNLAFVLTTRRQWPQARRAYQEALRLDPDIPLARAALAKLEKAEQQASQPERQTAQAPPPPPGNAAVGYVQFDNAEDKPAAHP